MLAMHLMASIAWIWTYIPQPWLDMSGVGLRNHGQVRLENCLVVVDGRRAVYPDSICQLVAVTHNYGHQMKWLYHWAHIESWLVEVNLAKKNSKDWSYIQGATSKFENIGQIGNLTCMLYLVDTVLGGSVLGGSVLGVDLWSWHGETTRDDWTLSYPMIHQYEIRNRDWGWKWKYYGAYEQIWVIRSVTWGIG
jgi:hypothetical protein